MSPSADTSDNDFIETRHDREILCPINADVATSDRRQDVTTPILAWYSNCVVSPSRKSAIGIAVNCQRIADLPVESVDRVTALRPATEPFMSNK